MFRLLRRMRRDERGQAMVIGAVAMLVLAVSVMASVSIGHGVYEKIKLQDAADAQAYSIAVKEARAYNFLAYTNRAMVVHYSAMLTVMSYVSHAVYLDQTLRSAASVLKYIPVIGAVFAAVEAALKFWKAAVEVVSRVLIPILTGLNIALWLAQEAMLYSTLLDLVTSDGNTVIQGTDPKAQVGVAMTHGSSGGNPGLSVLRAVTSTNYSNLKNFLHPIDDGPRSSGSVDLSDPTGTGTRARLLRDNRLSDPDMAKYRLLMGNLANAVRRRWTAEGEGPVLIGRRWNLGLCVGVFQVRIAKTADSQIKSFRETFENNRKDQLYAADDIQIRVRPACFFGRWRTVFQLRFRAAADAQGGFHQEFGRRKTDDHHDWTGITPFVTSDPSFIRPWQYHFGYPCNVTVLSKDMGAVSGASTPFQMKNLSENAFMKNASGRIDAGGEVVGDGFLDMTWKYVGGSRMANGAFDVDAAHFRETTGGMMAIAVGRAVYHRPGVWKEEPNFFNPLWTARLAPVKTHWEDSAMRLMIREWDLSAGWFRNAFNY
ncbi:pilus assembly protein [Myxococcus sp. SDU36]|uniref:pilus assembly protein n=1 Tax=Myxococcus sp. SDU36 TaxID=2831967 RepID=UPI00254377E3|nr:pilus assembly protein [Myxococcus sp. SDU36]WIG94835.1 pilus assembly protein [Myxococcus sp. SDU36]